MLPTSQGSFRLFRFKGINVHLHWSWFVVAIISVSQRVPNYESPVWALGEYLGLFVIVLLHEFGHSFASRQVGGSSDQIVLWPFGGVAFVNAPQRPGATLWSIAAGPLVNVVLLPVIIGAGYACRGAGLLENNPDLGHFLRALLYINVTLLLFNLLPVYPLDGGQILRSVLWYPLGRARSLQVATIIGLAGGVGLVGLAIYWESLWTGILAAFLLMQCWSSFKMVPPLLALERLPRRSGYKCPSCHTAPPSGALWACPSCHNAVDAFASNGTCPHCSAQFNVMMCPDCQTAHPFRKWDATIIDA
jgi:Zn-dependent protease